MLRAIIVGILCFSSLFAEAINNDNFWLPSSYREWLPEMRTAAETLETTEECQEVIKARLHEGRSTLDNPVFRFVCREADKSSFSVTIDAVSGKKTYANPMRSPAYRAQKAEEERQAKLAAAKARLQRKRTDCEQQVQQKTRFMRGFRWVSDGFVEPQRIPLAEVDAKAAEAMEAKLLAEAQASGLEPEPAEIWVYDGHFDAQDAQGQALNYQVRCAVPDEGEEVSVKISRRAD